MVGMDDTVDPDEMAVDGRSLRILAGAVSKSIGDHPVVEMILSAADSGRISDYVSASTEFDDLPPQTKRKVAAEAEVEASTFTKLKIPGRPTPVAPAEETESEYEAELREAEAARDRLHELFSDLDREVDETNQSFDQSWDDRFDDS